MIDIHVHLRDWEQSSKETVDHGLAVAYKAGIRRVFDMPNTNPPLTTREAVIDRLALASDAITKNKRKIAYSLYVGLTADVKQIKKAVSIYNELFPLVCGLKLFAGHSTGNMGLCTLKEQELVFNTLTEENYRGVVAVHAEKESLIDSKKYIKGKTETHSLARPSSAEVESVRDLMSLVEKTGFKGHLHICHISVPAALELVLAAKERGVNISAGATPHHLLLSTEDAKNNHYLKMNPPLRSEEERKALFQALLDGKIDNIESDHAPHTLEDKENGASGIQCFSGMLILLHVLRKEGVSEESLQKLFGKNVLKIFSLEDEAIFLPRDIKARLISIRNEYPFDPFEKYTKQILAE